MGTAKKLKTPAVRDLTRRELIKLRALGESMAEKVLGPDWKNRRRKTNSTIKEAAPIDSYGVRSTPQRERPETRECLQNSKKETTAAQLLP
jgi:hypothetical protein